MKTLVVLHLAAAFLLRFLMAKHIHGNGAHLPRISKRSNNLNVNQDIANITYDLPLNVDTTHLNRFEKLTGEVTAAQNYSEPAVVLENEDITNATSFTNETTEILSPKETLERQRRHNLVDKSLLKNVYYSPHKQGLVYIDCQEIPIQPSVCLKNVTSSTTNEEPEDEPEIRTASSYSTTPPRTTDNTETENATGTLSQAEDPISEPTLSEDKHTEKLAQPQEDNAGELPIEGNLDSPGPSAKEITKCPPLTKNSTLPESASEEELPLEGEEDTNNSALTKNSTLLELASEEELPLEGEEDTNKPALTKNSTLLELASENELPQEGEEDTNNPALTKNSTLLELASKNELPQEGEEDINDLPIAINSSLPETVSENNLPLAEEVYTNRLNLPVDETIDDLSTDEPVLQNQPKTQPTDKTVEEPDLDSNTSSNDSIEDLLDTKTPKEIIFVFISPSTDTKDALNQTNFSEAPKSSPLPYELNSSADNISLELLDPSDIPVVTDDPESFEPNTLPNETDPLDTDKQREFLSEDDPIESNDTLVETNPACPERVDSSKPTTTTPKPESEGEPNWPSSSSDLGRSYPMWFSWPNLPYYPIIYPMQNPSQYLQYAPSGRLTYCPVYTS